MPPSTRYSSHAYTLTGAAWETAALFDDYVRFAQVPADHPALVVHLEGATPIILGTVVLTLTAGLFLAPWQRRQVVVGVRLRHGRVTGMALIWLVATLPWPLVLLPGEAAAQGQTAVHFHPDHLGSTLAISGPGPSAPPLLEEIRYWPYGDVRYRSGNAFNGPDYEFTGYETQANLSLDYANARFYDPVMGTFLTHDPAGQFTNPYSYTAWDPINLNDPTGAQLTGLETLLLIAAIVALASAVDTLAQGGTLLQCAFRSIWITDFGIGITRFAIGITGRFGMWITDFGIGITRFGIGISDFGIGITPVEA